MCGWSDRGEGRGGTGREERGFWVGGALGSGGPGAGGRGGVAFGSGDGPGKEWRCPGGGRPVWKRPR